MILALALLTSLQQQHPPSRAGTSYLFFVASAGIDQVALVRFGAGGARIEHRTSVRLPSIDSARPLAVRVAPDGRDYYVTTRHGFPRGELLKLRIAADSAPMVRLGDDSARGGPRPDTLRGREPLDSFPGPIQITRDGEYAWVPDVTPDSSRRPSWISVIYLKPMVEVARIATCATPRGGELSADGTRYYSLCQQDDRLVEIDTHAMKMTRDLALAGESRCGPAAVVASADGARLFVSCRAGNVVLEVDANSWSVTRRISVGTGPGEEALSHDGHLLVVANQGSDDLSLVDLASGRELGRVTTLLAVPPNVVLPDDQYALVHAAAELARLAVARRMAAGVVIAPDDRYAFVTVAPGGAEPGAVDVIDLATRAVVATVEMGPGTRGIAFWKVVPGGSGT